METTTAVEISQAPAVTENDVAHHHTEDVEVQVSDQRDSGTKCELKEEEMGAILEVIAATGKFWHDWDTLKALLSFRLKQVLGEYPEAQMDHDQQSSSLGETYAELVRRLNEALFCFVDGPPFTLQRICEILLTARSMYPNLSKLALALEKNLLVTSTLTISADPYPSSTIHKPNELDQGNIEPHPDSSPLQNGVGSVVGHEDEEMADAEEVSAEDIATEEIAIEEGTVDNKDSHKETTEEMADAEVSAEEVATEEVAVDNKVSNKETTEEMSDAEEVSAEEVVTEEVSAEEVATEEVAVDNKDSNKETTEEKNNGISETNCDQKNSETSSKSSPSSETS